MVAGNIAAFLCVLALVPLNRLYSERRIVVVLTLYGILATGFTHWVSGFPTVVVYAVLLGSLVPLLGSMSNLMVYRGTKVSDRGRYLCILHTMYGVGSVVAPFLGGFLLARGVPWEVLVLWLMVPLLVLGGFVYLKLPEDGNPREVKDRKSSIQPLHVLIVVVFAVYTPAEVLFSSWLTTYLVERYGLTIGQSSTYLTLFFCMLAGTRVLSFFSLSEDRERKLILGTMVVSIFFYLLGQAGRLWAYSLVGLMGPVFPLLLGRVNRIFPEVSKTLTLVIILSVQVALGIFHSSIGRLIDHVGIGSAYWVPGGFMVAATGLLLLYFRREKEFYST